MIKHITNILAITAMLAAITTPMHAQQDSGGYQPVTKENYVQAETDLYLYEQQEKSPVNTFEHADMVTQENQVIIRSNRDVVYSRAIVDISEGVTFSIPKRDAFQVIHVIDENHLTHRVIRAGETVTMGTDDVTGGTHVYLLCRTQITDDLEETKAAQKAMKIEAKSSKAYVPKGFKKKDVEAMRKKLVGEYNAGKAKIIEHKSFVPTLEDADPESYVYAAAVGWGGLPSHTAQYLPKVTGQGSDAPQQITIPKPDLDWDNGGFFSLTTYDSTGWIVEKNFYIGYKDMQDNGDSYTIYVNAPDKPNSITVQKGWTGVLRFYLPRNEQEFIKYIDSLRSIRMQPIK
jgi:hypothetical protein